MPIAIVCPACNFQGNVPDTFARKSVKCRQCAAVIPVSAGTTPAITSAPAPPPATPARVPTPEPFNELPALPLNTHSRSSAPLLPRAGEIPPVAWLAVIVLVALVAVLGTVLAMKGSRDVAHRSQPEPEAPPTRAEIKSITIPATLRIVPKDSPDRPDNIPPPKKPTPAEARVAAAKPLRTINFLERDEIEIGQIGRLAYQGDFLVYEVLQIIDRQNMLVSPIILAPNDGPDRKVPFWVRGLPTRDLVDKKRVRLPQIFEVKGTQLYKTIAGGTLTVYVLEPEVVEISVERERLEKESEDVAATVKAKGDADQEKRLEAERRKIRERLDAEKAAQSELLAEAKLKLAKRYHEERKLDLARKKLREILEMYPQTEAAKEARELVDKVR